MNNLSKRKLEVIWRQVPPDYYEKGKKRNLFQKVWHGRKWKILDRLLTGNPKTILDVGCASGHITGLIKKKFPNSNVTGTDVSKIFIDFAKIIYPNIKFYHYDAHNLGFKDKSFKKNSSSLSINSHRAEKSAEGDFGAIEISERSEPNVSNAKRAIVRELHVYGQALNLGDRGEAGQHKGYGKWLMDEAEKIAKEQGIEKLEVISGIGVREYYKKLGYEIEGFYMVKKL